MEPQLGLFEGMKESFKVKGTITDSKGRSINFTEKDIINLEIESGTTKRIVNNRNAIKLQELVKERIKERTQDDKLFISTDFYTNLADDLILKILQSIVEESEK